MTSRRAGFTLVEMLIVTVLGALVMGSIYQMIVIQDRTTRQQYAIVQNNQNARMALAVLTADLKEISARDGDITDADSTRIAFRALRKAGIACQVDGGLSHLTINNLGQAFAGTDSVLVFVDGANLGSTLDDAWVALPLNNVNAQACPSNPLGAATTTAQRLHFSGAPLGGVAVGALVRSFVPTRYQLITNGEWGQIERSEAGATAVPIIDGLAPVSEGGLHIRYIDSTSAVIPYTSLGPGGARLDDIMRIEIKVRGKAAAPVTPTSNRFSDSLVTQVYVRGNARSR